mmetsp:Transcript_34435/g.88327  ORF Transcript_34435/g.88327 Transcript_34435/m.88327 type:complete len:236 (+) Transcript_34435:52-759(+)
MAGSQLLEDEFKDRDAMGLQPQTEKTQTEEQELCKYFKMLVVAMPIAGQVFAWSSYLILTKLLGMEAALNTKFAFIHEHELGYVFLAVWLVGYTRAVIVTNANAARAPARVDRPDQHVYKVMAASGPLKDAPYVMMAGTGPQGRFNRAQRGVINTDEALPLLVPAVVLTSSVFGPMIALLILLWAYGRITFAFKYKESTKARVAGFLPAVVAEKWIDGLVLLCAIKGIFYTHIAI